MIPNFQIFKNLRLSISMALAASIFIPNGYGAALAQVSDVPRPDGNGDFTTAIVPGHRGYYGNKKWLVVPQSGDRLDANLNCRYAPNGEIRSRIAPGLIVEAVFLGDLGSIEPNLANDAIVESDGVPWLRVRGHSGFHPGRAEDPELSGECYVRANWQYIVPVNNDESIHWQ